MKLTKHIIKLLISILIAITLILNSFYSNLNYDQNINVPLECGDIHLSGQNRTIFNSFTRSFEHSETWPTFHKDYLNSGNSTSRAPETNNTLWKFNDDGAQKGEIYSTPIVFENIVYFTTKNGYVYAIDRITGDKKWQTDLQKQIYSTPTYLNGFLYVGTGTEGVTTGNYMTRISTSNGQEDLGFRINLTLGSLLGAPVVLDKPGTLNDRLYFATIKTNTVFCYNLNTVPPQQDWSFEVPNSTSYSSDGIWSTMAYVNDTTDGKLLFTINSDSVGKDISKGIFCLNARTGKPNWEYILESTEARYQTFSSPTVYYDTDTQEYRVLFGAGIEYLSAPSQGKLYCLSLRTGKPIWNYTCGGGSFGYGVTSSPVVAYDRIFFGSCDGKLYAVNRSGSKLWDYQTEDSSDGIYSSPAVADGKIYFGSCDGYFYCLNVFNGSLLWRYNTERDGSVGTYGVASSPAIASNRVFVGSCNGYLYCFGTADSAPPTLDIDTPVNNEMINGTVEVRGTAEDDIAVLLVQIRIDNGTWSNATGRTSWRYLWNTTEVLDGSHIIHVRAFDETGFSVKERTVIVNNGGSAILIQITSHTPGQIVAGITRLKGIASHSLGLEFQIQIRFMDVLPWVNTTGSINWYYDWYTEKFTDGEYFVKFRGYDGFENSSPIQIELKVQNKIEPIIPGYYPMFRMDYNRSGKTEYKVPEMGRMVWKFETENSIESSAIYYNKKLYFGSNDWYVYCLDSATGKLIWKYETNGIVRSSPAIAGQRLYIGSHDYYLYCLNANSGELLWRFRSSGEIDTSPLIVGDYVIFGSYDGKLYALNSLNGTKQWVFDTDSELWSSQAYTDNCVYTGAIDGRFYCIWLTNGTERWNFSTNLFAAHRGIYSTPVVAEDNVLFGCEDNILYCLNATTGKLNWLFKTTGYIYSSAAVTDDKVFISSLEKENDGVLYSLPLKNPNNDNMITMSEKLWSYKTHDFDGGSSPTISSSSGQIVIGSNDGDSGGTGKVYCLNAENGSMIWNFTAEGDIHSTPLVANNHVYIGSLDNYMYCLGVNYSIPNITEELELEVKIQLPVENVTAGERIENITLMGLYNNNPVAFVGFNLNVSFGALSTYTGTSSGDGIFKFDYLAPGPELVTENTSVVINIYSYKFGYKPVNGSTQFMLFIKLEQVEDNNSNGNDSNNNNTNGNGNGNGNDNSNGNNTEKPDDGDINNTAGNETKPQDAMIDFRIVIVFGLIGIIIIIIAVEIKYYKKR